MDDDNEPPPVPALGVLAFGDSITNGGGELQWGVALQSWALWVARGLGLPYTGCAVDGAIVGDVLRRQIPDFQRRSAHPEARYELGCVYIGVNDVRRPDWDPGAFGQSFARVLEFLSARCDRTLTLTIPLDLGRPRVGEPVLECNATISDAASRHGALLLDLSELRARNLVMADRVHLTAFGQIAVAQRALEVLARDGMAVAVDPATLISYETSRYGELRGELTYGYRSLKQALRARWPRLRP
jgi:lysophospholipase L1-like esterase